MYQFDAKAMGCYFLVWPIVVVTLATIGIVVIIVIINRKWEAIKFFMYMRFDILPNDDGPEDLDDMEFDAFVAYRSDTLPTNKSC